MGRVKDYKPADFRRTLLGVRRLIPESLPKDLVREEDMAENTVTTKTGD